MRWRWIAVALLLLAGCVPPADNRVEITYQTIETLPEQQALHQKIIYRFQEAHPRIRVRVIYDTSKFQKLNVQLAGNAAPDVFYYIVDRLPALAQRGVLADLTTNLAPVADQFYPEVIDACRVDGKLYMVPFHFSTDVLLYNRDWFQRAGEPVPDESWDWQKFADVAARLATQRGSKMATVLPRPLLLVQSFGGVLFADGKCTVNSPETVAALQFYRDLVAKGIAPTTAAMGEVEAFDGVNVFRDGKIPLLVGRTYMLTEFDRITDFRWDVAPVPKGRVRWSRLSIGGNCVWSGTKHPQEAAEFARFYSTEGAMVAAQSRNAIPALRSAADSAQFPPVMKDALKYSRLDNPWGYAFWDEFNQKAFFETTDAVALGRLAPADAARDIEKLGKILLHAD
ncbi:MAG TPA: sugar ABC transporter substrate-binding protein [Verrucomicrobiae bacterium]|nr:sugar ABC transporter substrate-binding protein [Verrucomicrobiae bacterium]